MFRIDSDIHKYIDGYDREHGLQLEFWIGSDTGDSYWYRSAYGYL
jgi:hypothetical protein